MGGQIDRGVGHDSGATFTLTSGDDGKYIQVEVTINDASDNDAQWERKYANRATPAIAMRPPVEGPANVAANVPSGGGSVKLNWGLTSFGGARPTSFQYRYSQRCCCPATLHGRRLGRVGGRTDAYGHPRERPDQQRGLHIRGAVVKRERHERSTNGGGDVPA